MGRAPNTSVARDQILILRRASVNREKEEEETDKLKSNKYTIKTPSVPLQQKGKKKGRKKKEKKRR